ncbi:MAG TPA: PQQ-binding-like beta-propeller repeat protein [Verrucomicrobiae bacterium]
MEKLTSITRLVCIIFLAPALHAANWPGWRGPDGTGISTENNLPLKWSTNENVRWRVELPERGNSSPVVWDDRVFVTQAITRENRRTLLSFDRKNGKQLWQSGVTYTEQEQTQRDNPYCSATPATDGERIIVSFGSAGLYCYDFTGKELWHKELGKMSHMFGNASSPVIHGDLAFFNFGPDQKARLVAVNKKSGDVAWEVPAPKVEQGDAPMRGGPGRGGFGGPGAGPGGRGGFGSGTMLATQMLTQGDKNQDGKLSKGEFDSLANAWFDKLDPDKTGKLSLEKFTEKFTELIPPQTRSGPPGDGAPEDGQRPGRGFNPGRFAGPGLFTAADSDKDGSLTREEWKSTFTKWFADWDSEKSGAIDQDKLAAGLTAALPRPNFGGPGGPGGRGPGGRGMGGGGPGGSWSTPMLVKATGHDELIMNFPGQLAAFDPATGKQLWYSKGIGSTIYTSPVIGEGTVVASSSGMGGGNAIAVKFGGSGEVTESQRLWRLDRAASAIGSGVIFEGRVYTISQDGIASCTDLKSGKSLWSERLKGPGARGSSWSSILLADGKLYVPNQSGDVFVLRAGETFELLATNSVRESTNASLAASDGDIFLRTDKALWCFGSVK